MPFPDGTADFRSDTVTRPTAAMRRAMAEAEVGDDGFGEDPTVNHLQDRCAELLGTEAALFVPSGTMGNQLAIWLQTRPGSEVLCVETAHIRNVEMAAGAVVSGVQFRGLPSADGTMTPDQVRTAIVPEHHHPRPALLAWENTHALGGGRVVPLDVMVATSAVAHEAGIPVHLDGARLFNAAVATGITVDRWAAPVDTVQVCMSKGLGAPVGSLLCGRADVVAEARYGRKLLGGGWRQAGVVAAAALVALEGWERLADDHALARRLALGLAERFPGCIDPTTVDTNLVIVDGAHLPMGPRPLLGALAGAGVLVEEYPPGHLRFVTHRDVDGGDVARVLGTIDAVAVT